MSTKPSQDPIPSDGERNALVGFNAQFMLAAKIVYRYVPTLQWIRVADPSAGVADDFQFVAGGHRHALQVKWSQFPSAFTYSNLFGSVKGKPSLFAGLAQAWKRIRTDWADPLTVHLVTNNFASVSPGKTGTDLATAIDSSPHLAAFLARSLVPVQQHLRLNPQDGWAQIAGLDLVKDWSDVWTTIKDSTGLTQDETAGFLRDFDLAFLSPDSLDLLPPRAADDHNHLAGTLQRVVADRANIIELNRSELMATLGWDSRIRFQHPHSFPVPDNYTANGAARAALEDALAHHEDGYLALIGPPGSGKSTLVEKVSVAGRLVRYYAFVPDAPDPLNSRGEAESFLHDLSLALEVAGVHRDGFGSDLAGQRTVLFDQLARAGEAYTTDGTRTTIVIDGLDHISREQNPTRSLLNELPARAALPAGVCVVLGSQTTSILPTPIQEALEDDINGSRIVEVPPLADPEVEAIAAMAGVTDWLLPGHVRDLVDLSEGHPLVLTYMIEDLRALASVTDEESRNNLAGNMLTLAAEYRGSIDQRYSHYLGSLANDDDAVFAILGTVSRLRVSVHLDWLETWVAPAAVTRFAELTHTFFRRNGDEWTFIHNSFRRFLVDQTAMVGGHIRESRSRELHKELADQCAASPGWPQYQDEELAQRYLAGEFEKVLEAATPELLRASLFAGRPYGVVRDQASIVLRAAAEARDYRALNRTLIFINELNQRGYVIDAETLASAVDYVDPGRVVEHVVQGRSLRVKTSVALEIAARLAADDALEQADAIVRAVGGLQGLVGDLDRAYNASRDWSSSIGDWAEVVWHRSGMDRVLDELDDLLPFPPPVPEEAQAVAGTDSSKGTGASADADSDADAGTDTLAGTDAGTDAGASSGASDDATTGRSAPANKVPDGASDDNTPAAAAAAAAGDGAEPATQDASAAGGSAVGQVEDAKDEAGTTVLTHDRQWTAERDERQSREQRAAVSTARNFAHARCFDLATDVRDSVALSRLAERITAESSLDWRARMHVIAARAAQQDGDSAEVLRQVQLLLALENPNRSDLTSATAPSDQADQADDEEPDDEQVGSSNRRVALNLRVFAATTLVHSGQPHADELQELLPPETEPAWPDMVGSADNLEPYNTMLIVLRMRELHDLIGIYDNLPDAALKPVNPVNDPARTRFRAALDTVAALEAQALASTIGLADPPDVPAFSDPVVRLLELPLSTTRKWTGWYRIPQAGIELIAGLVPLAHRCGADAQLARLLAQFKSAWDNPDRAVHWPASRRVPIIRAAAAYAEAVEWCHIELNAAISVVNNEGDPHSRATVWLDIAKARTDLADHDAALAALGDAHRDGWGPGQHDDDYQLVSWLSWLIETADLGAIDRATFLNDACTYAARLVGATDEAGRSASEAANTLISAVFRRDAKLGTAMSEALCDRGVINDAEAITAVLQGAAERTDVDADLVASFVTELLMPLTPGAPRDLCNRLLGRAGDRAAMTDRFTHARSLWSVEDTDTTSGNDAAVSAGTPDPSIAPDPQTALPITALLAQMRAHADSPVNANTAQAWSRSIEHSTGHVSRAVALAALDQAERLGLTDIDIARLAGMASRTGASDRARDVLGAILARTAPYGWRANWDGGSRIKLFEAAINDPTDDLVDLAARDLTGLVATKAIAGEFMPRDLKRFVELLGGNDLVSQCWTDIREHLDVYAPARDDLDELDELRPTNAGSTGSTGSVGTSTPDPDDTDPELELASWAARYLAHPIRILDFGARRVLAHNYSNHRDVLESVLARSISAGGAHAEAALHTLAEITLTTRNVSTSDSPLSAPPNLPPDLSPDLLTAVREAAVSDDGINRHLAFRVLTLNGHATPQPPHADLPASYQLELPTLPKRELAELDSRGVPFVDTSNPQQVIAPFDAVLKGVASEMSTVARNLYYRASSLGQAKPDQWTTGGHHDHYERLKRRGLRHVYRPWAYSIGRRGCARVLAELLDASLLPGGLRSFWFSVLIDEALDWITPQPLDETTPLPWQEPGSKDYASEEWCDQAPAAAEHYAKHFADNRVLAERSNWRWLAWETPKEIRRIQTRHGTPPAAALLKPPRSSTERTVSGASSYPDLDGMEWNDQELVVYGDSWHSDSERTEWLALHPAVAEAVDWTGGDDHFEWVGQDGHWRARTVYRVRGQLSHEPPSKATCAEVCQVVLSTQGWNELAAKFPRMERTVRIKRVLKQDPGGKGDRLEKIATATIPDTHDPSPT